MKPSTRLTTTHRFDSRSRCRKTIACALRIALLVAILCAVTLPDQSVSAAEPQVRFQIADDVSTSDADAIEEGVSLAISYLAENYEARWARAITVEVQATEHPTNPGVVAFANGNYLAVFTGSQAWAYLSPALRLQVIVHELVHVYQFDMIGGDNDDSPAWFIEGMAEYVSFEVMASLGVLRPDDIHDAQTFRVARELETMPALADLERFSDFQGTEASVYPLSYLAVEILSGDDPADRLAGYLDLVGGGSDWRQAFERTFGIATADFYDQFQDWVDDEMTAPSHNPDAFAYVATEGVGAADAILLASPESAAPADQILVTAITGPSASCSFIIRDGDGERVERIRTVADGRGLVFWLVTMPSGSAEGDGVVKVDCGGSTDSADLRID